MADRLSTALACSHHPDDEGTGSVMTRDEMSTVGQELARRYVDTFNDRDLDAWMALFVEDAVVYDPFVPEPSRGRNAIRNVEMAVLRAFPDMRWRLLRPAVGCGGRVPSRSQ